MATNQNINVMLDTEEYRGRNLITNYLFYMSLMMQQDMNLNLGTQIIFIFQSQKILNILEQKLI